MAATVQEIPRVRKTSEAEAAAESLDRFACDHSRKSLRTPGLSGLVRSWLSRCAAISLTRPAFSKKALQVSTILTTMDSEPPPWSSRVSMVARSKGMSTRRESHTRRVQCASQKDSRVASSKASLLASEASFKLLRR